jgi:hypothetical protein
MSVWAGLIAKKRDRIRAAHADQRLRGRLCQAYDSVTAQNLDRAKAAG